MNLVIDPSKLLLGGLLMARAGSFLLAIPGLGMARVPLLARLAFAAWMVSAAWPMASAVAVLPEFAPLNIAAAIAGELLTGLMLAFSIALLFAAAQMGGNLVGVQVGFSIANVIDPQNGTQVSILGQFYYLLALLVFLAVDGPLLVAKGLIGSFQVLPVGAFAVAPESLFTYLQGFSFVFSAAVQVAAPVMISLVLVDISLGVIGRSVPQLNVLVIGFPLKIGVGLTVLAASIGPVVSWLEGQILPFADLIMEAAATLATGR